MNPSYFRINISMEKAIARLEKWQKRIFEKKQAKSSDAVDFCLDDMGKWKKGACLFAYENDKWTVFEDLKGSYSDFEGEDWLLFAMNNSLIFAGYNDAVLYGRLVVIEDGKLVKDFFEDFDNSDFNHNDGTAYKEIKSWTDVASFIEDDALAFSDEGIVLI